MKTPRILTTTIASVLLTAHAFAVTDTWDGNLPNGGAGDSNISTALNWADDSAPLSDLVNTDLIFAGTTKLAPNFSAVFSTDSVTFNNTAGAFVLGGSALTIGTTGIVNSDAQMQTFNNQVTLGTATTTFNAASGGLTFGGTVALGTNALALNGGSALLMSGAVTGTGTLTKTGAGTATLGLTGTSAFDLVINTGAVTTSADAIADTFDVNGSIAINGTSSLTLNENLTLDGAQLTRVSGATLTIAAGRTLTLQNSADATFTGGFSYSATAATILVTGSGSTLVASGGPVSIAGGTALNIAAGGAASSTSSINIGTLASGGTMSVDGAGSTLSGSTLTIANAGGTGSLTLSNGGNGTFGGIVAAAGTTAGTNGTLTVQSGATATGTSLTIATSVGATTGTVTINGAGSVLTVNGAGTTTIGAASGSTAALGVQFGGVFNSGTGPGTVNRTGSISLAVGTFNSNGNLTLDGGLMVRGAGSVFALAAGRTLTIQNDGDFLNSTTNYSHTSASTVTVTGAGSTLDVSGFNQLRFSSGSTLNVLLGADASAVGSIFLGAGGDTGGTTATVDGAGSSLITPGGNIHVGESGNTATLTFSNNATGTTGGTLNVGNSSTAGTSGTAHILSGATVTAGGLALATAGGATTTSLTRVQGGTLTINGAGAATIGAASGSAALRVQTGGIFNTSTGTTTVNPTGTLALEGGAMTVNGNLDVNGGQFSTLSGSTFNQLAGTFTVRNGGDATFNSHPNLASSGGVAVTGTGSTLTNANGALSFDGSFSLTAGGTVSATGFLDFGLVTPVTALIDGSGSSVTGTSPASSLWGAPAGTSTITFSDNATGNFTGIVVGFSAGSHATLHILSSADVTMSSLQLAATTAAAVAVANVGGAGSTLTITSGPLVLGEASGSSATLNIASGATVTTTSTGGNSLVLNPTGTVNLNGGALILGDASTRNGGALNFNAGLLSLDESLTVGAGGQLGENLILAANRQLIIGPGHTTTIDALQTLTLNGGSLTTSALVNNGTLAFNTGRLAITGAAGFNIGTGALGANVTLGTGATLAVSQTTTINAGALLRLNGGVFTSANVTNNGTLDVQDGALNITGTLNNAAGSRLFVGGLSFDSSNVTNAGRITLLGGLGEIGGAGTITNTGVVTGDGTIGKSFANSASGQVRTEAGKTLLLTGAVAANAGTYSLEGGTLEFTSAITNSATGTITGFGALRSALLTNNGNIGLSGDARFYGDVTNAAGARIITSGGSTTTFYDDVIHNGTEIRTSAGGASVFFGAVSGAGPFTGTGTVYFEGDLQPGNSPASVLYEGDLVFGGGSSVTLEIGGLALGAQYDHLQIGGAFSADGDLVLALLDDFKPQFGDTFDLLDVGTFTGDFDTITAPALGGGNEWDFSALKTTGTVTVVPEPGIGALLLSAIGFLGMRRSRIRGHAPSHS